MPRWHALSGILLRRQAGIRCRLFISCNRINAPAAITAGIICPTSAGLCRFTFASLSPFSLFRSSRDTQRTPVVNTANYTNDSSARTNSLLGTCKSALRSAAFLLGCIVRAAYLGLLFTPVMIAAPAYFFIEGFRGTFERLLRRTLEYAGPAFIKLGQWASTRPDIFPLSLVAELSSLHDQVPPHSMAWTLKQLNQRCIDLGISVALEPDVIGCGCIAQVYRGFLFDSTLQNQPGVFILSNDGHDVKMNAAPGFSVGDRNGAHHVAIKVRHPRITTIIEQDLAILYWAARALDALPTMHWLSMPEEAEEFGRLMRAQLDLRVEGQNLNHFRTNFAKDPDVNFPEPLFATEDILIEEYVDGIPVAQFVKSSDAGFKKRIASALMKAFFQMTIIDNFIHADLHPGNIFIQLMDGDKVVSPAVISTTDVIDGRFHPRLVFLDTGLVTKLSQANSDNFIDLFSAVADGDGTKAAQLMVDRARPPPSRRLFFSSDQYECIDYTGFVAKMKCIVGRVQHETFRLGNIHIADVLGQVLNMVRQHHVRIESDFTNLVVSITVLEGLGRQLDPDVDLFEASRPFLRFRKTGFYTTHKALFLRLSAFLEARYWFKQMHDESYDIIDVLLYAQ